MSINDPIGDALTRIRNAYMRSYTDVEVLNSSVVASVLEILKDKSFIESIDDSEVKERRVLKVKLKYNGKKPAITSVSRVSKPGLRKYLGYKDIPRVLNGFGISILSTPKGIMTGDAAKSNGVGGEFVCTVY